MLDRSHSLGFARNTLDRMSNEREDPAFIARHHENATSSSLVLSSDAIALKRDGEAHDALFSFREAEALGANGLVVFLGCRGDQAFFASRIDKAVLATASERDDLACTDLRTIAAQGLVSPEMIGALSQAKSLLHWHDHNGFCANCGHVTRASAGGARRECDRCERHHFPRVEPVAIMMVSDGERCLLGRQTKFPPGMYSCLAGFAEVGETLEDTVRREIMEEAGITVGRVSYHASQPWPFPSSLMIGCMAEALTTAITIDPHEIEDARWFSREDARQMLARTHPDGLTCPPPLAIANLLIAAWALDA